jgi:RNA polymerase sigma-70 factor (ECF subfamily)
LQATLTEKPEQKILTLLQQPPTFERGFSLLMEAYQERVYAHVRRMLGNHEDANDVVQNCFVKVYRNIHRFEGKAKLYTWIYRIATNEALTFLKKKQRRQVLELDDEEGGYPNQLVAGSHLAGEDIQKRLQKAMNTLPEKQLLVFSLRYFEDMSYSDMSEVLGTSVGGLKASYHHAVKKIEEQLRNA